MNVAGAVRMAVCVSSLASACMACSAPLPPGGDQRDASDTPSTTAPMAQPDVIPGTVPVPVPAPAPAPTPTPTPREPTSPAPPPAPRAPQAIAGAVDVAPAGPPRPRIDRSVVDSTALPSSAATDADNAAPVGLTINALSRGRGVPADTRDAFQQIRALLEQQQADASVTELQYQRIGLEGESRLCVEFRNRTDAQAALARIRTLSTGVDLLEVVEAPCPSSKEYKP